MAAMLLSQGTPMVVMGDEIGRSQQGNNNAYCQDNELFWVDWNNVSKDDRAFCAFTSGLITLRKRLPLLRQAEFLHGETALQDGTKNVTWLRPDAKEMQEEDWSNGYSRSIGLMLARENIPPLLILLNAYHEDLEYKTPRPRVVTKWRLLADSARGLIEPDEAPLGHGAIVTVPARSVLLYEALTIE